MSMQITPRDLDIDIKRLIDVYGEDVLRICYIYLKNKDLAEDAFQETFIKAYKKWNSFKGQSEEKTWLIRIAINTCKDFLKSAWIRKVFFFDETRNSESYTIEEDIINEIDKGYINDLIKDLPKKYKDIIILYYYEDYSIKDISGIVNLNEGIIKNRLSRARKMLKNELEKGDGVNYESRG